MFRIRLGKNFKKLMIFLIKKICPKKNCNRQIDEPFTQFYGDNNNTTQYNTFTVVLVKGIINRNILHKFGRGS